MEHLFLSVHEGCPHVTRGLVPTSSNCLTWAFTLPFLSEVAFEFLCQGSGEKGKSNITSQPWGLGRPRFRICFMWSQTSSACGPNLVTICACQKPRAWFGAAGRNSLLFGSAPRRMVCDGGWGTEGGERRSLVPPARAPCEAGRLRILPCDSYFQSYIIKIILELWWDSQGGISLQL